MKQSEDLVEILKSVTRQSCNAMHMIGDLLLQVRELKNNHCWNEDTCPNGEFRSARSPEILDEITDKLIYMLKCEANCGVGQVAFRSDGKVDAQICEFDDDCKPLKK